MKIYKNVPAVIALALSFIASIGLASALTIFGQLVEWANSSENPSKLATWLLIIFAILAPLLAIFAAVSPALKMKENISLMLAGATLTIILVLDPLANLLWYLQAKVAIGFDSARHMYFPGFENLYDSGRSLATVFGVLATISLVLALVIKPKQNTATDYVTQIANTQNTPVVGGTVEAAALSGLGVTAFPTLTLVLAFFSPVIAVILGHITLNHMRRGLISQANISTAKTGLIISYVFIGLGVLVFVIWVIVIAAIFSSRY